MQKTKYFCRMAIRVTVKLSSFRILLYPEFVQLNSINVDNISPIDCQTANLVQKSTPSFLIRVGTEKNGTIAIKVRPRYKIPKSSVFLTTCGLSFNICSFLECWNANRIIQVFLNYSGRQAEDLRLIQLEYIDLERKEREKFIELVRNELLP